MSHLTQNRLFWGRTSQPICWLEKQEQTRHHKHRQVTAKPAACPPYTPDPFPRKKTGSDRKDGECRKAE